MDKPTILASDQALVFAKSEAKHMKTSTKIKTMASASVLALLLACGGGGGAGVGYTGVTENASLSDQLLQIFLSSVAASAAVVTAAM